MEDQKVIPMEVYAGLFRVNDGSNNSISFDYEGISYKFSFLVTKKFFLNFFLIFLKLGNKRKSIL